jgi:ATP-binding cassette subfamily C (CFTR/MRP) protein 1
MVLLLLRLLDPIPSSDHSITIDGLQLDQIDRNTLRARIIALPQDTFFLPDGSTYLANVDPHGLSSPAECESALNEVGLWNLIKERGGLEEKMAADSLSQGQKQLFSLARAVLRARIRADQDSMKSEKTDGKRSGILLLDEVSSSVDGATDVLIQQVIRKEFDGYTVIAVAHRVDSVKDFDKMVLMENGSIKDVGEPSLVQAGL